MLQGSNDNCALAVKGYLVKIFPLCKRTSTDHFYSQTQPCQTSLVTVSAWTAYGKQMSGCVKEIRGATGDSKAPLIYLKTKSAIFRALYFAPN